MIACSIGRECGTIWKLYERSPVLNTRLSGLLLMAAKPLTNPGKAARQERPRHAIGASLDATARIFIAANFAHEQSSLRIRTPT
jgi:hypothetical protein